MLDRITGTLDFNAQALKLRAERQQVIAGNIANADTPGYKAVDFDFSRALSEATASQSASASTLATSSAGHVASARAFGSDGAARLQYRTVGQPSMDANTVDTDVEQARFADNTVRYEASLKFLNGQIRTLMSAITGQS
jgi:flagellar basal-body rod protein FlgB